MIEITSDEDEDDSAGSNIFSFFSPQLWFNRVDALHIGLTFSTDLWKNTNFFIGGAYKTGLKKWSYETGLKYDRMFSTRLHSSIRYHAGTDSRYQSETYSLTVASIAPLFAQDDYFDYYWKKGWLFNIGYKFSELNTDIVLGIGSENHSSLAKTTDFNIVWSDFEQRENPGIENGKMTYLTFKIQYGQEYIPFGVVGQNRISLVVESSDPGFLSSDYSFTKYLLQADWRINTFLTRRLLPNALDLHLSVGYSSGNLPLQRFGEVDGSILFFTPYGSLKSRIRRPYEGEKHLALFWEHNFRTVPFELINFDLAVNNGIGLIIYGSHGRTWIAPGRLTELSFSPAYIDQFHHEIGISINSLFSLFRIDTSFRIDKPGVYVGLSLARFF
jgi:hypothetical protein